MRKRLESYPELYECCDITRQQRLLLLASLLEVGLSCRMASQRQHRLSSWADRGSLEALFFSSGDLDKLCKLPVKNGSPPHSDSVAVLQVPCRALYMTWSFTVSGLSSLPLLTLLQLAFSYILSMLKPCSGLGAFPFAVSFSWNTLSPGVCNVASFRSLPKRHQPVQSFLTILFKMVTPTPPRFFPITCLHTKHYIGFITRLHSLKFKSHEDRDFTFFKLSKHFCYCLEILFFIHCHFPLAWRCLAGSPVGKGAKFPCIKSYSMPDTQQALYSAPRADISNYHQLGGLKQKHTLPVLEADSPK